MTAFWWGFIVSILLGVLAAAASAFILIRNFMIYEWTESADLDDGTAIWIIHKIIGGVLILWACFVYIFQVVPAPLFSASWGLWLVVMIALGFGAGWFLNQEKSPPVQDD